MTAESCSLVHFLLGSVAAAGIGTTTGASVTARPLLTLCQVNSNVQPPHGRLRLGPRIAVRPLWLPFESPHEGGWRTWVPTTLKRCARHKTTFLWVILIQPSASLGLTIYAKAEGGG